MKDDFDFLLAEYERFLQINTMVLIEKVKHSQISQKSMFAMSLQYLKQEVIDEVAFLHAGKHQSWFQHFRHQSFIHGDIIIEWAWANILSVLKVASLQYLYSISKKKLGKEFISIATAFVLCFDAKYSDMLWGTSHVYCFIFNVRYFIIFHSFYWNWKNLIVEILLVIKAIRRFCTLRTSVQTLCDSSLCTDL